MSGLRLTDGPEHPHAGRVFGVVGGVLGGKTDLLLRCLAALPPEYLRLYCPGTGTMPRTLHDGIDSRLCIRSLARIDWRRRLGVQREMPFDDGGSSVPTYAVSDPTAELAALQWARDRAHAELPIVVGWNEAGALADDSGRRGISERMNTYLSIARHGYASLIWCTQSARQIHWQYFSSQFAHGLVLFRVSDRGDLKRLEEGGVPDAILARLPELADYEHVWCPRARRLYDPFMGLASNVNNFPFEPGGAPGLAEPK